MTSISPTISGEVAEPHIDLVQVELRGVEIRGGTQAEPLERVPVFLGIRVSEDLFQPGVSPRSAAVLGDTPPCPPGKQGLRRLDLGRGAVVWSSCHGRFRGNARRPGSAEDADTSRAECR